MGYSPNATLIRGCPVARELLLDHYKQTQTPQEKTDQDEDEKGGFVHDENMMREMMEMRVAKDPENSRQYSFFFAGSCEWTDNYLFFGVRLADSDPNTSNGLPVVPKFDFEVSTNEEEHFLDYVEQKLGQNRAFIHYSVYMLPFYG